MKSSNKNEINKLKQKIALSERSLKKNPEDANSYSLLADRYKQLEILENNDYSTKIKENFDQAIANSSGIHSTIYKIHKADYYVSKEKYQDALNIINNCNQEELITLRDNPEDSTHHHARNVAAKILESQDIKAEILSNNADLSDSFKYIISKLCDAQGVVTSGELINAEYYPEYQELIASFREANLTPGAVMARIMRINEIEEEVNITSSKVSVLEIWKEEISQKVMDNADKVSEVITKIRSLDKDSQTYARDLAKLISENDEVYTLISDLQSQVEEHADQLIDKVGNEVFEGIVNEVSHS